MSQEPDQESSFDQLLEKSLRHLETRWEYYSLTTVEKVSGAAAAFTGALIISIFILIILFFFSIGFALWLGDYIGNRAGGFALAGLLFVPVAIGAYIWIPPWVRSKIIHNMLHDEDTEDKK